MQKVIIADDESITLEAICAILERSALPLQVVGTASNGLETMELLLQNDVDVVITDVKMPVMDGIALMQAIKSRGIRVKVIVLSAYRDFEYAQEAVNNGASGYLLKPLKKEQLLALLGELDGRETQPGMRQANGEKLLNEDVEQLLLGTQRAESEMLVQCLSGCWRAALASKLLADTYVDWPGSAPAAAAQRVGYHTQAFCLVRGKQLLLIFSESPKTALVARIFREFLQSLTGSPVILGIGSPVSGAELFLQAYRQAEQALEACFYQRPENTAFYGRFPAFLSSHIGETGDALEKALVQNVVLLAHPGKARGLLQEFYEQMQAQQRLPPAELRMFYTNLLFTLKKELHRRYEGTFAQLFEGYAGAFSAALTLETVHRLFLELLDGIFSVFAVTREREIVTKVELVKAYCETHYQELLSLDSLAELVGLSKNYLCHLFKETQGLSLWDYLTALRMEKAKELLSYPNTKANQIGQLVGYPNAGHFGRVFKTIVGMTPMKYKKKNLHKKRSTTL